MIEPINYSKVSLRDTILLYLIFGSCHPAKVYHCNIALDKGNAKQYLGIALSVIGMCKRANKNVKEQSAQCKTSPHTLLYYDTVQLNNIIIHDEVTYSKILQLLSHPNINNLLEMSFENEMVKLIGESIGDLIMHLENKSKGF